MLLYSMCFSAICFCFTSLASSSSPACTDLFDSSTPFKLLATWISYLFKCTVSIFMQPTCYRIVATDLKWVFECNCLKIYLGSITKLVWLILYLRFFAARYSATSSKLLCLTEGKPLISPVLWKLLTSLSSDLFWDSSRAAIVYTEFTNLSCCRCTLNFNGGPNSF